MSEEIACAPHSVSMDTMSKTLAATAPLSGGDRSLSSPANGAKTLSPYLVGPLTDTALMGGLGILAWIILYPYNFSGNSYALAPWSTRALSILAIFLWYPHFVAGWRPLYRPLARCLQVPIAAIILPFMLALGVLLASRHFELLTHWCKIAALWLGFHITHQTLGLAFLYARRSGFKLTLPTKIIWSGFLFASLLYALLKFECHFVAGTDLSQNLSHIDSLHLPPWMEGAALLGLAFATCILAGHWILLKLRQKATPPLIALVPMIMHALWLLPGKGDYVPKFLFLAAFHGLQYLVLTEFIHHKEIQRVQQNSGLPQLGTRRLFQNVFMLVLIGLALFKGLPIGASMLGLPHHLANPAIISALVIHHCFSDGLLWKVRDPSSAKLLLPKSAGGQPC